MNIDTLSWRSAETARVDERRRRLKRVIAGFRPAVSVEDDVGLALSGGGIRSATFCLGLLRALGRAGKIPYIDYLSTVSGGGYIGSFLCSMFVPQQRRGDARAAANATLPPAAQRADPFAGPDGVEALDHLRQSGRHLMMGGGDAIRIGAIVIRNLVAIHFVIGLTLLTLFLVAKPLKAGLLHWDLLMRAEARAAAAGLSPWFWPSQWLRGMPIGHGILLSFWLYFAVFLLGIAALFGSAHWLTQRRKVRRWRALRILSWQSMGAVIGGLAGISVMRDPDLMTPGWTHPVVIATSLVMLLVPPILIYALAECVDRWRGKGSNEFSPVIEEDRVRHMISQRMGRFAEWGLVIGALGILDSIAQTLYTRYDMLTTGFVSSGAVVTALIVLSRRAMKAFTGAGEGTAFASLLASSGRLLALVGGLLLAVLIGTFWAVIAHALAWQGGPIGEYAAFDWARRTDLSPGERLWILTGIFVAASFALARSWDFLNLSSFASFYSGRLRRAYLAASNDSRLESTQLASHLDEDEDDIRLIQYYEDDVLAPLHLINVTINDTTGSSSSNLTQRDRRGKPLVISSAGFLFPEGASPADCGRIKLLQPTEKLPLSTWMGISGAAFSTGLGQHGSIGLSLLAGLSNLRLGYWWEAGSDEKSKMRGVLANFFKKKSGIANVKGDIEINFKELENTPSNDAMNFNIFPVINRKILGFTRYIIKDFWANTTQNHLRREFLGRFTGSDGCRWYLTDGGHFENTGVYELIRRRVGFIIAADCGADPRYLFADVTRMMRLIRIDFGAELTFLDEKELDALLGPGTDLRHAFASLEGLGLNQTDTGATRRFGPYAAIGRIEYLDDVAGFPKRPSTIILIKPRVCGSEMPDLLAYAKANPPFPQQTTGDQFFDEAQWESYYRLGELIGDRIFGKAADPVNIASKPAWMPAALKPL